jgi:hypothetical protein
MCYLEVLVNGAPNRIRLHDGMHRVMRSKTHPKVIGWLVI